MQVDGFAYLVAGDALLLWTPEGYARRDEEAEGFDRDGADAGIHRGMFSTRVHAGDP